MNLGTKQKQRVLFHFGSKPKGLFPSTALAQELIFKDMGFVRHLSCGLPQQAEGLLFVAFFKKITIQEC